jgi:hypothetical protein
MRPVRKIDPADLWFGVVFGLIAVGVFALYAIVAWDSVTSSSFQSRFLPIFGLWIAISIVRRPIDRLGRGPRFLAWFLFGTVSAALFTFSWGDPFNPGLAAGMGLALAIVDLVTDHFRQKREAEHG